MLRILSCVFFIIYSSVVLGQDIIVQRMSDSINTQAEEYWPTISADGNTLIFNRLVNHKGLENEDFYYSTRDSLGNWSKAQPLSALNTEENEGAQTLSADGRFMVFTSCNNRDSYGSCDLFYSIKIGDNWLPPRNLGKAINTKAWETQPSLSADGTELYFVSNRKGGKGGMDIWHSKLLQIDNQGHMHWSEPENLNINTAKSEVSPFIHSDNKTLYFSSNGYTKQPQFDIYISRKQNNTFTTPENIGAPINTSADEIGLVVNTVGTTAYFASNREGNNKDIYTFPLPAAYRPEKVQILQGRVINAKDKSPLLSSITLQSATDSSLTYYALTDFKTGEYLLCLTQGETWRLSAQSEGYLFHNENIDLQNQELPYEYKDIELKPIEKEVRIVLNHIFFDTDKATLKSTSKLELEHVKQLLNANPSLKIELSGHTDSQGSNTHNQQLSEARAKAVYDWLVAEGISPERLAAKGYGEHQPVATNATAEGRAKNRRTELKVLSF
ncbi:outer membrane protein OmpA-like peptidoglycan-associated protein [Balneicella halophila]|uniref:Outer membrane protein OmpA-like peptidoglycan-associated protein n=1 Tax=Balneicella halophila TaxID=1537566 RepID=A0A7L4UQT2_BALHA|nr:OmpA family protein [Balneicella halophila]PVX50100.1 outer membrane protein OmpA-like peptidoglycan-associated protein [Balneicella halophila]